MVDIGGEGQKTAGKLKSGSAHAINMNVQEVISSVPVDFSLEPDSRPKRCDSGLIPNWISPGKEWPPMNYQGKFYPFEDGFSDITLMEGAPLFDYNAKEIARTTSKATGWIVLKVDDEAFEKNIKWLANEHNGGTVWRFPDRSGENGFPVSVIPPKSKCDQTHLQEPFRTYDPHTLYDTIGRMNQENESPLLKKSEL